MIDIDKLERLERAASPGPWVWHSPDNREGSDIFAYEGSRGKRTSFALISRDSGVYGPDVPTCEFIMAARAALPELLAELRAARAVVEAARDAAHILLDMGYGSEAELLAALATYAQSTAELSKND